jgi:ABC-2 type transport system permease protein
MNILRVIRSGFVMNLKMLGTSSFFLLTSTVQPVIFATIAYYMFLSGGRPGTLLYAALGAGMMGVWSTTLFGSGGMIQWQRWQGTLELSIASPAPFLFVLLPMTLASATIGLYSLTGTLLWGRLLFGVPFEIAHPLLFLAAVPATVIGLGLLGLVMASTFILWRNANALSNLLEYPIWLVTGLLVPISLLPGWVAPLAWVLAPTWGVRAIRDSALGGGEPLAAIGMCLALGGAYLVIGSLTVRYFENLARDRATLSLT